PFRFCLNCGVSFDFYQKSDLSKLASLGTEGRGSATTILSLFAIEHLRKNRELSEEARKLLSFTDNRQDASLQAGHFNDFVQIGQLRAALYKAVSDAGDEGLRHDDLVQKVTEALGLPFDHYAQDPTVRFGAREETDRALRSVLGYRLYQDLKRGWRITLPNLEQCGLLKVDYLSLDELCEAEDVWEDTHPALRDAPPSTRSEVAKVLLDFMRRELCIKVDYLDRTTQEQIEQRSSQYLKEPWALDDNEDPERASLGHGNGAITAGITICPLRADLASTCDGPTRSPTSARG
ncbi:MAG: hypothetical protein ABEL51_16030, partial [Salinibacter sp.]